MNIKKMFLMKYLFNFIFLHLINATPQLNLYYIHGVNDNDNALQHNCLRIITVENSYTTHQRELISYCMSELPSKFNIDNDNFFPMFTFDDLSKQNIASQELYLWSAPIDLIERYEFYLNQLTTTNDLSLAKEVFYNCTLPRFGPKCQYQLYYYDTHHSSLHEIIKNFYQDYNYNSTNFTCYTHLNCNRGLFPACLDWSEVCDGKVDCIDGGFDEEHCWQLEINQCKDNEYRCENGQCIPQSFYKDESHISHCVDDTDEPDLPNYQRIPCWPHDGPSFACEDIACPGDIFTSSCVRKRKDLLIETMSLAKDSSATEKCWSAFICLLKFTDSKYISCDEPCEHDTCIEIIQNNCPDMLFFPNVPILFSNIYFAYRKNDLQHWINDSITSIYICYDTSQYDDFFVKVSKIFFNNRTCIHSNQFLSSYTLEFSQGEIISTFIVHELYELLRKYHLIFNYTSLICNRSNIMYQCVRSSKCISIYRVMDNVYDCPYMDDENVTAINNIILMQIYNKTHFKCPTSDKYIHQTFVGNGRCNCDESDDLWCPDEDMIITKLKMNILFQHICDGFIDLLPRMIMEQNETDETECEQWQCDNIYTHCNNIWNCPNGVDESDCGLLLPLNCSSKHHLCVSPDTNQLTCLSVEKTNDGKIDCLGATDEPTLCGTKIQSGTVKTIDTADFYCINQSSKLCIHKERLCDRNKDCEDGDDEQFCTTNGTFSIDYGICTPGDHFEASDVEKFFCDYHQVHRREWGVITFKLDGMYNLVEKQMKNKENPVFSDSSIIEISDQYQPRCHRGLDLLVWLNNKNNLTRNTCLCPSSYYGDICQYQNQRISLTIKFRSLASSRQILFSIIISLIDDSDERIIHSYEQITHLALRNCHIERHMYLIYSTRPKDPRKHYSIHIDIYEKMTLDYRGSLLLPDTFPFLPVLRLAIIVDIPRNDDTNRRCSNNECIHGKCIRYSNTPENITFCQCDKGWSGRYCTIQHSCTCASDSLCIGISSNNRSICVCPLNKFGPRCFLTDTICQTNKSLCQNGGQCISTIDYMIPNQEFVCICQKGFTGDRCEIVDNKLILSFEKDISVPQQIFIHFIELFYYGESIDQTKRRTTFKTIPVKSNSLIIYWSQPFHLVFIEFVSKIYYLTVVQNTYNQSTTIIKMINQSNRCPNINELFNKTFIEFDLIRRIKYYHLPCQNYSLNLSCFYDETHFCLCYDFQQKRLANCFKFDHDMKLDCSGQSECENGGECFEDNPSCPQRSICLCPICYYGRRCQFSTNGFGLSLDAILGYHILPNVNIIDQPSIVQTTIALTIIFFIAGLINGVLALITFKNKVVLEVGCGLYLLASSITTLLTMLIFGLKYLILIHAQITAISNRSFLSFQCRSIDFLLRICLCMDQWLNACVAIERAITTLKGTSFSKKNSKKTAKLVIIILLFFVIGTCIHDPFYRRLIIEENNDDDDDDEKRIWCIASYPSSLQIWDSIVQIFNVFATFMINLISAIILIRINSRRQSNFQTHKKYKELLREQFRQHKHLLTAPAFLVILAIPRVIIACASKCMKSTDDSWLFLMGYFISFIPPMLTFIIFILPSKFYKKEFRKSIAHYRTMVQRTLRLRT